MEKTFAITKNYLRNSDGVLFIYDITNKDSFEGLDKWYKHYKEEKDEIVGVLLENKCDDDKKRQVDFEEAKKFADEHHLEYFETSAKLDIKVKKAIVTLLEKIINSKALYDSYNSRSTEDGFKIDPAQFKNDNLCKRFCKKLNPVNWFK